jgi:hypothetical protein
MTTGSVESIPISVLKVASHFNCETQEYELFVLPLLYPMSVHENLSEYVR